MMKAITLALLLSSSVHAARMEQPFLVTSEQPHQVTILEHGADSLAERLRLINLAQHSIDVEYFIYNNDQAGRLLTQALVKRAKEGVKVRMLLDYFSTKKEITPEVARLLADTGIEVKFYNTAPLWRVARYMVRNHRKLLQIDGGTAILGGRNVADEYYDLNREFSFIDRDVVVDGPLNQAMHESFEAYWNHDFSQPAELASGTVKDPKAIRMVKESDQDRLALFTLYKESKNWQENRVSGVCRKATFGTSKPGMGKASRSGEHLGSYLMELLASAPNRAKGKGRVIIDSAYFIVDKKLRKVLTGLVERGTQVDIITNSIHSHDVIVMTPATQISIRRLSKKGIRFWTFKGERPQNYNLAPDFQPGKWASHVKSLVLNDDTFMVGSYNFDPRAHHINGELALVCEDSPELTAGLGEYFDDELSVSNKITNANEARKARFKGVGFGGKLKYIFAWPLSQMIRPLL